MRKNWTIIIMYLLIYRFDCMEWISYLIFPYLTHTKYTVVRIRKMSSLFICQFLCQYVLLCRSRFRLCVCPLFAYQFSVGGGGFVSFRQFVCLCACPYPFVCLPVCPSCLAVSLFFVCQFVCLSVCLFLSVSLSICLRLTVFLQNIFEK